MLAANSLPTHAEPTTPGTNGHAPLPPSAASPGHAILQYVVEAYPPDLALRLLTFASTLPDDQAKGFLDLLRTVDAAAVARTTAEEQVRWQRLLAHLPGLAPTLELLRAHLHGSEPPCTADGPCTLGS
jgi:hypothetical protein